MTLLRASIVLSGLMGANTPRRALGSTNSVLVARAPWWSKKAIVIKNPPYTIDNPTLGQLEARINFGREARSLRGTKGFENGMPAIAWRLGEALRGRRMADSMPPEEYPSRKQRTVHTLEQLEAMLEKKTRAPAPRPEVLRLMP